MAQPASLLTWNPADGSGAVGIVASAGGISALTELLAPLPANFPLPIIVVQHLAPRSGNLLPALLARSAKLKTKWAEAGEIPLGGTVYIASAGCKLDLRPDGFTIAPLPPSASSWLSCPDTILTSLARCYGAGAIGIVLSGMIAAGVAGMRAIHAAGGLTMAQSEASAEHFAMPLGAIDLGKAEIVTSPWRIAEALLVLMEQRLRPCHVGAGELVAAQRPA
jgi:chemotaxis response regulator CheB